MYHLSVAICGTIVRIYSSTDAPFIFLISRYILWLMRLGFVLGTQRSSSFPFSLNFLGWHAMWIGLEEDQAPGQNKKPLQIMRNSQLVLLIFLQDNPTLTSVRYTRWEGIIYEIYQAIISIQRTQLYMIWGSQGAGLYRNQKVAWLGNQAKERLSTMSWITERRWSPTRQTSCSFQQ